MATGLRSGYGRNFDEPLGRFESKTEQRKFEPGSTKLDGAGRLHLVLDEEGNSVPIEPEHMKLNDMIKHHLLAELPRYGVIYLGAPFTTSDGHVVELKFDHYMNEFFLLVHYQQPGVPILIGDGLITVIWETRELSIEDELENREA